MHIANDYRSPMKVNPELLNRLHSVYLLAKSHCKYSQNKK